MTPRQRILSVIQGDMPDQVPFTIKRPQPPMGEIERRLRNEGLAICTDRMVFSVAHPNVEISKYQYQDKGRVYIKETFKTPVGQISQLWISGAGGYGSDKLAEYLIKRKKIIRFWSLSFAMKSILPNMKILSENRKYWVRTVLSLRDG